MIERHQERMSALDELDQLLLQLKAARETRGLSLADLTKITCMDRSALSKLENGQRTILPLRPWCDMPKLLESD